MSDPSEESVPYEVQKTSISFGEGPPQVVVYLEHLDEALAYVRDKKIVSIEVSTHRPDPKPQHIDFSFLNEIPNLSGLECRMNIAKNTDLGPLYKLKKLTQLAWPARTTPEVDLSYFPGLEYLSFRHRTSTRGWQTLSKLRTLRLSVSGEEDLKFLKHLESLVRLEVADSDIKSMSGIERLNHLQRIDIFILSKLMDISTIAKCKNLKYLYVENTKNLTDFSPLAKSASIETLKLLTPIDSVSFVPRMKSLKSFFSRAINSNDLSPLLQAKSLNYLDIYPEKRSYTPKVADIKQALGLDPEPQD
jgi:internalin A